METIEFAYSIVVSKWVTLSHQYPTIDEFLKRRKKWFKNDYLEKPLKISMKIIFLVVIKKRRRNLNDDNLAFHLPKKQLRIDKVDDSVCENKFCDDDMEVVKIVPSLVIGKHH